MCVKFIYSLFVLGGSVSLSSIFKPIWNLKQTTLNGGIVYWAKKRKKCVRWWVYVLKIGRKDKGLLKYHLYRVFQLIISIKYLQDPFDWIVLISRKIQNSVLHIKKSKIQIHSLDFIPEFLVKLEIFQNYIRDRSYHEGHGKSIVFIRSMTYQIGIVELGVRRNRSRLLPCMKQRNYVEIERECRT